MTVQSIRSHLEFILAQIQIAERNAAGESLLYMLPKVQVPWGLRTVDGTLNNRVGGQNEFGAADNTIARTTSGMTTCRPPTLAHRDENRVVYDAGLTRSAVGRRLP